MTGPDGNMCPQGEQHVQRLMLLEALKIVWADLSLKEVEDGEGQKLQSKREEPCKPR